MSLVERQEFLINRRGLRVVAPVNPWDWDRYADTVKGHTGDPTDYTWYCNHSQAAYNKALNSVMDQVKDMKVNLGQMFAERKQVVNSVYDTSLRLANAIVSLRRGNLKKAAAALGTSFPPRDRELRRAALKLKDGKAALWQDRFKDHFQKWKLRDRSSAFEHSPTKRWSQDWLALQYGWLPLLSDIHGSAELLAQHSVGRRPVITARRKAEDHSQPANISVPYGDLGVGTWIQSNYRCTATVHLEFEADDSAFGSVLSQTGLSDPLLLAWELVPYSFVVDWLMPIGPWLQRLGYDSGLRFKRGYYVLNSTCTWECSLPPNTVHYDGVRYDYDGGIAYRSTVRNLTRTVYTEAPRVSLPEVRNPFSPTRALNALALLRMRVTGKA